MSLKNNNTFLTYSKNKNINIFLKKAFSILKSLQIIALIFLIIFISTIILVFPEYSSNGVKTGLTFCSNILIPSLFPFMVISGFIVKSNLALKLGKIMNPVTKFLFHLPGCTGPTILLGLIGGYPTSARGIKSLFEQKLIDNSQAERMLYFSVCAGPAFVISVVGTNFLKSSKAGIIILTSQIISSITLGIITGFLGTNSQTHKNNTHTTKVKSTKLSSAFINSCTDACYGLINLCSLVVIFSVAILILNSVGFSKEISNIFINIGLPYNTSNSLLPIFLEVTSGCMTATNLNTPLELIAFALGWAGICVQFQILSTVQDINISVLKFMSFRFLHGLLASFFTNIILHIVPIEVEAISNTTKQLNLSTYSDYSSCVALILLSIFFIISIGPKTIDLKSKKC